MMPGDGFASVLGLLLSGDRDMLRVIGRSLGISVAATSTAALIGVSGGAGATADGARDGADR
jgi:ABC-type tungstate transport system substrate-binding protein